MSQKIRQEQILHILEKRRYVTVRYLCDTLHYSSATINRDLNAMQRVDLVKRSYGGVELVEKSHHLPPLPQRQIYMKKEKRRLACAAAELIENGDTVFLDGSTTVQHIIPFLADKKELTVITNNMRLAIELGELDINVICLGGRIIERPHVLYSDETVENAMRYCVDKAFFSVAGVTEDGRIKDTAHYLLYKLMMKNSKATYFLTDKTKLVESVDQVLCDFSLLTGVIADFDFSEETKALYPDVKFMVAKE